MQTVQANFSDEQKEKLVYLIRDCGWPPHTAVKYLEITVRQAYAHLRSVDPKLATLARNRHQQYDGVRSLTYQETQTVKTALEGEDSEL